MDNVTQLFVRACKQKSIGKNINSMNMVIRVYKRFYLVSRERKGYEPSLLFISSLLLKICDDYGLMTLTQFAERMSPAYSPMMYGGDVNDPQDLRQLKIAMSAIRFARNMDLPGLQPPAWWRNRFGSFKAEERKLVRQVPEIDYPEGD